MGTSAKRGTSNHYGYEDSSVNVMRNKKPRNHPAKNERNARKVDEAEEKTNKGMWGKFLAEGPQRPPLAAKRRKPHE